jgi:predicted nucleic acid-binding protein
VIVYADTSALAKLTWDEDGSTLMQATFAGAGRVVSAVIGYTELRSALVVAIRVGKVSQFHRDDTVALIDSVWATISEIVVDHALAREAGELAERFRLCGYDAVHLAALTQIGLPGEVTFACWDLQLLRAAKELGYTTVPSG